MKRIAMNRPHGALVCALFLLSLGSAYSQDAGGEREAAQLGRSEKIPGTLKWKLPLGGNVGFCSPAIGDDGTLYFGSKDGNLYALHGGSGGLAETPWPMHSHALCHTGRARRHVSEPTEPERGPKMETSVERNERYEAFLEGNPAVKTAVESGRISRENVIAGMKTHSEEKPAGYPTHAEAGLRGKYAYKDRWSDDALARGKEDLKRQAEAGSYWKQVLQAIKTIMIEVHVEGETFVVNPEVLSRLKKLGLTDEQVTFVVGLAQQAWVNTVDMNMGVCAQEYTSLMADNQKLFESGQRSSRDSARVEGAIQFSMDAGNRALRRHFDAVVERGTMTREEADALLEQTQVGSDIDWDARYRQFLEDNPTIKARVDSGAWTQEPVMTLIKTR